MDSIADRVLVFEKHYISNDKHHRNLCYTEDKTISSVDEPCAVHGSLALRESPPLYGLYRGLAFSIALYRAG